MSSIIVTNILIWMNEMNQIILTDEVAELIEPIDGDSKTGVDAKSLNEFLS